MFASYKLPFQLVFIMFRKNPNWVFVLQKVNRKWMFYNLKMKESFCLFTFLLLTTCTLQAIIFTDSLPSIIKISASQYIISTGTQISSSNPSSTKQTIATLENSSTSKVATVSSVDHQLQNIITSLKAVPSKAITSEGLSSTTAPVHSAVFEAPQIMADPYTKPIVAAQKPLIIGGGVVNPTVSAPQIISYSSSTPTIGLSYMPATPTHSLSSTASNPISLSYMPATPTLSGTHSVSATASAPSIGLSYMASTPTLTYSTTGANYNTAK